MGHLMSVGNHVLEFTSAGDAFLSGGVGSPMEGKVFTLLSEKLFSFSFLFLFSPAY